MEHTVQHFDPNRTLLKALGLSTGLDHSKILSLLYYMFVPYCYFSLILFTVNQLAIFFVYPFEEVMIGVNINFPIILGLIKFAFLKMRFYKIARLLNKLENPGIEFENNGDFTPTLMLHNCYKRGLYFTVAFSAVTYTAVIAYLIPSIYIGLFKWNGNESFPYLAWAPFYKNSTQNRYFFTLLYLFFPIPAVVTAVLANDTLFMNTLNLTATHLDILRGALRSISKRTAIETEDNIRLNDGRYRELTKCNKYLQIIYSITDEVEDLFQFMTMMQASFSLVGIASTLLNAATMPVSDPLFGVQAVYVCFALLQLNLYCLFGHIVSENADRLLFAIYENEWIGCDSKFLQGMLITMSRLQRPLYFTLGQLARLALTTNVFVIKSGYSFFTMLKSRGFREEE